MLPSRLVAVRLNGEEQPATLGAAPEDATASCDTQLHGAWVSQFVKDGAVATAVVDDSCGVTIDGRTRVEPRFSGQWILVGKLDLVRLFEPTDPSPSDQAYAASIPDGSWLPLAWTRDEDALALGAPDAGDVGAWIVQGHLDGRVICERRPQTLSDNAPDHLTNIVSPSDLAKLPLAMDRSLLFRRVGEDADDLEKFLKKNPSRRPAPPATPEAP